MSIPRPVWRRDRTATGARGTTRRFGTGVVVALLLGGILTGRAAALTEPGVTLTVVGGPFATGDTLTVDVTIANPDPDDVRVTFEARLDGTYSPSPPLGGWAAGTPDTAFVGACGPAARQVPTFNQVVTCSGTVPGGTTGVVRITAPVRLSACAPGAYPMRLTWTWADPTNPAAGTNGPDRATAVPLRPTETCAFEVSKRAEPATVSRGAWATWVIRLTNRGDPYWLRNDGRTMGALLDSFDRNAFEAVELVEGPASWRCDPTGTPYDGGAPPPYDVLPPGLVVQCAPAMDQEFLLASDGSVEVTYRARVPAGGTCLPPSQVTNRAFAATGDLWGTPDLGLGADPRSWRSDAAPVTILGTDDPACSPTEDGPVDGSDPVPPGEPVEPASVFASPARRLAQTGVPIGAVLAGGVLLLVGVGLLLAAARRAGAPGSG